MKIAALVTALIALNVSLGLFGYSMAMPNWILYVALIASIIVLLSCAIGLVVHGGHGCYMCSHDSKSCNCDKLNCNCK